MPELDILTVLGVAAHQNAEATSKGLVKGFNGDLLGIGFALTFVLPRSRETGDQCGNNHAHRSHLTRTVHGDSGSLGLRNYRLVAQLW